MPGIYIHIPFCHKRCVYCDFYLVTNLKLLDQFLYSLKKEITLYSEKYRSEKFNSIYFGGGTPSILSIEQISALIGDLKNSFIVEQDSEVTLEANPEDLMDIDLNALRKTGINRLSIGVQSFLDDELSFLTRQHTGRETIELISEVNKVFDNYSVDLIYSLPGQTEAKILKSIETINKLNAPHVSAYALTYEERTPLFKMMERGDVIVNSEEKESDFFEFVSDSLTEAGYDHYEVSSFCRPGKEARHNSKYWTYDSYIGLGPSAHSFFDFQRWNNIANIGKYNQLLNENTFPVENQILIEAQERNFELILTGLRSKGIALKKYKQLTGEDFTIKFDTAINTLVNSGFAEISEDNFRLTRRGFCIADEIIAKYF